MADTPPPAQPKTPQSVTITLSEPIRRGETLITEITLRKPKTGALRGLKVDDLFGTDVNTLIILLPRITTPPLIVAEIEELEAEDLLEVAGAVRGFFMTSSLKEAMARTYGVQDEAA